MKDHQDHRQAIIDACLAMNREGINQGIAGNVSLRKGDDVLITPSGVPYETMRRGDIVRMNLAGEHSGPNRPSSEWRMHLDIYRRHAEARAVVHAHPDYCTALACLRRGIPPFHYMVAVAGGRDIRCSEYATFGTEALSREMLAALDGRRACLLGNHGMICYERDLDRALRLA
ncbi:MAG: class II aldolase/adducin family protein, partial [Pseudomonadota bacterium]|nr:class II aldolase/adducin family protein [Pseudomonadota bacterium]